jgi:hypothetical protein|tara:strand:+ start:59 stop:868 length:810 start_codon:yes stop_codon:yes gene_type:complete
MAESITKRTQRAVIRSVDPFGYEQGASTYLRFLGNMASGTDEFSDEQIGEMVERVYPGALKRGDVKPWKEGDYKKGRRPPERVAERIDMLNLTIGDPQVYNSMKESVFTPTRGAEEGDKFYTFRDRNQIKDVYNNIKKHIPKMEKKKGKSFNVGYKGDVRKGKADFSGSGSHVGMERFQVSVGEDDIGKYMAVYDNWDIDYGESGSKISNIAKGVLPGFQIYDRVYYDVSKPKSDLKIRKSEMKISEPKKVSFKKQKIQNKLMNFLQKI